MKTKNLMAIILSASMLSACAQPGSSNSGVLNGGGVNKQDVGTLAGAGLGAWAGSAIGGGTGRGVAMVAGGLLGGLLGNQIGAGLDKTDRIEAEGVTQRALETGQPGQSLPWKGRNASGTVVPSNYYQNSSGQYCREFTQKINVGGKTQSGYGTACRQPDGSWQVVSQ